MRNDRAVLLGQLIDDLLKDSIVRRVGALDEAVKQYDHVVELESILSHNRHKVVDTILKEKELGTLRVSIKETIGNHAESINHELKEVDLASILRVLS